MTDRKVRVGADVNIGNLKRIQTVFAPMVLTLSSSGLPPLWRPSGKLSGKWRRQLQKSDVAA
jgi:hypothetical protein